MRCAHSKHGTFSELGKQGAQRKGADAGQSAIGEQMSPVLFTVCLALASVNNLTEQTNENKPFIILPAVTTVDMLTAFSFFPECTANIYFLIPVTFFFKSNMFVAENGGNANKQHSTDS